MIKLNFRYWLLAIIGIHFLIFMFNGLFRHWGFLTTINDTGNFDQAIWGVLHEGYLHTTNIANEPMNRLAGHFDPILYAFVPFYAVYPSVGWIIGAQALALATAAWPIFLLGFRVFQSEKVAFLLALAFLVNPFVLNAGAWDFHPITLAVPFIALALLGLESKNYILVLVSVFFILLCKEHLGVLVVGLGLVWLYKHREWLYSVLLMIIGVVHAYVVLIIIMPSLTVSGSGPGGPIGRYAWLGSSFSEIIWTMVTQPIYVLETAMISMGGLGYLLILLLPFLFFPLLSPLLLLPGMADLAANMLSNITMPRRVWAYHSAALVPILTVAAMHGVKFAGRWIKKFSAGEISSMILIASIFMGYLFAPFPLPGALNYWAPVSFTSFPDPRVKEIRSLIGEESAVSAQANVGAHFSQRREIYCFPNRIDQVDAVVLRLESPTTRLTPQEPGPLGTLADHLQLPLVDYLKIVEQTLIDENFIIAYWDDPWLVFHRAEHGRKAAAKEEEIRLKINMLKQLWLNTDMSPAPKSAAN